MRVKKYRKRILENHNKERLLYIGNLIKEYRYDTQLSRANFAIEYDLPKITIQNAENGKNITLNTLFRILDTQYLTLDDFFTDMK